MFKKLNKISQPTLPPSHTTIPSLMAAIALLLLTHIVTSTNAHSSFEFEAIRNKYQNSVYLQKSLRPSRSIFHSNASSKFPKFQQKLKSLVPNSVNRGNNKSGSNSNQVLIRGNDTILSKNNTFKLGFFSTNGEQNCYLGIWYASISPPTYVWVANTEKPIKNPSSATLEIIETGRLTVRDSGSSIVWQSTNAEVGTGFKLLDNGNLVLLTEDGRVSWQSFEHPRDTLLPGMNLTSERGLTSWKSLSDPSPGLYSLRLRPPNYGEFELVFNNTQSYWSTGNWTGEAFSNVPEMMVPYIYRFHFDDPFLPTASFGFTEKPLDSQSFMPLTRFQIDYSGQLRQYTWSPQVENWNRFWSQPENQCRVFGQCGQFGLCNSMNENENERPCECLSGFTPVNELNWESGDYSDGCRRPSDVCKESVDGFEQVGILSFEGSELRSFTSKFDGCESSCLETCSCVGFYYNERTNLCKLVQGSLFNLRNLSSDSIGVNVLYLRVKKGETLMKSKHLNPLILAATVFGLIAVFGLVVGTGLFLVRRRQRKEIEEKDALPILNLRVFSYKELHEVTRGFSEKLGHGGFGTVFQGKLSDSTLVAVKRLERPGGGEKEFRAEVCTIGNIQHVNLVRLRGFCSENSHRLLVYDYMPNGPLSMYLRKDGPILSWNVRFRVAVGTARGIAYLHEGCRDCIIHCDIKPENVLLDSDYMAKVSDFGLAKLLGRDFSRVVATMRGTWGYVAPEWISGVEITTKADVYSYGMTLLELIGGRRNVITPQSDAGEGDGDGEKAGRWFFPPWAAEHIINGNVEAVIDYRLRGTYDIEQAKRVGLVAVWCIQDDEAMRPTMGMVVKMLEGVLEVSVPTAPKLLQALVSGESFRAITAESGNEISIGTESRFYDRESRLSDVSSERSFGNASSSVNEHVRKEIQ